MQDSDWSFALEAPLCNVDLLEPPSAEAQQYERAFRRLCTHLHVMHAYYDAHRDDASVRRLLCEIVLARMPLLVLYLRDRHASTERFAHMLLRVETLPVCALDVVTGTVQMLSTRIERALATAMTAQGASMQQ